MEKILIVFSGLPGAGKSTLADKLSNKLGMPVITVDPIEAAMWRSGIPKAETGTAAYEVARTIADEQLKLNISIIVDAVNPVEEARDMWRTLAKEHAAKLFIIEVVCLDTKLHKKRIENRQRNIPGMPEITWSRVQQRRTEYQPWKDEHLSLDSINPINDLVDAVMEYIKN